MNFRKSKIEHVAEQARKKLPNADIVKPKIPIEKIIHAYNIRLVRDKLSSDVSGASMTKDDGTQMIVVNNSKKQSYERKRFTMAHELGHLLLKHGTPLNINRYSVLFRDSSTSEGSDWREVEANYFAASLLMPKDILESEIDKLKNGSKSPSITEGNVESLANIFGVSSIAMSIRLSNLGFN